MVCLYGKLFITVDFLDLNPVLDEWLSTSLPNWNYLLILVWVYTAYYCTPQVGFMLYLLIGHLVNCFHCSAQCRQCIYCHNGFLIFSPTSIKRNFTFKALRKYLCRPREHLFWLYLHSFHMPPLCKFCKILTFAVPLKEGYLQEANCIGDQYWGHFGANC